MTTTLAVRTAPPVRVVAHPGPVLLAGIADGPSLAAHRARCGTMPVADLVQVFAAAESAAVTGRGGAGFPLARKLRAVAEHAGRRPGRRPALVVNLAEGEPASAKDSALALLAPHEVLDGADIVARALRVREIHVVSPAERPAVGAAVEAAVTERVEAEDHVGLGNRGRWSGSGGPIRWHLHEAAPGFVSGQARAVLELIAGRPGLPVTAWAPEAISGLDGRPTLLSNAETWAQLAAALRLGPIGYAAHGTSAEPGTTLLTLPQREEPDGAVVVEAAYGSPWEQVLGDDVNRPVLLGGYHGTWAAPGALRQLTVSRVELRRHGLTLGAGVVLPLAADECPVTTTWRITAYLAAASAGRCGPCRNGLPALAAELGRLADGDGSVSWTRITALAGLVDGRGACAHPDGTARLVRSMLTTFEDEVAVHLTGGCRA